MPEKEKEPPVEHPTVEEHAEALKVPAWAFAGLRVRMGWAVGTRIPRAQFERALREFLEGPTAKEGS
ncbi:hypothetical protein [Thermus hydrothermalis]|uniref:hypothetical protein n=1 Tax=Thermus hydrothermalis TaxID=2908148 RepID=UPI001FA948FA|nr:hypothetical protein [Thermus hydrothermalis]